MMQTLRTRGFLRQKFYLKMLLKLSEVSRLLYYKQMHYDFLVMLDMPLNAYNFNNFCSVVP